MRTALVLIAIALVDISASISGTKPSSAVGYFIGCIFLVAVCMDVFDFVVGILK